MFVVSYKTLFKMICVCCVVVVVVVRVGALEKPRVPSVHLRTGGDQEEPHA